MRLNYEIETTLKCEQIKDYCTYEEEVNNSPFVFPDELYNKDIINYLSKSEEYLFSERLSFFTYDYFDKNNINIHNIIGAWNFSRTYNRKCDLNLILAD